MILIPALALGPRFSAAPGAHGLFSNFALSYDRVFEESASAVYLTVFDVSLLPPSDYWAFHIGMLLQFPVNIKVFDMYVNSGFTVYPFKGIFSVTTELGLSLSNFMINHFAYQACLKANLDIPVFRNRYRRHYVSPGAGIRHRSGFPLLNYINTPDDYYTPYNSFFFEIAYRIKI
jgi:hypothetical protein